jgi:hypothetical protein
VSVSSDPASVVAAIKACERPDVALQLAFDATDNRKAIIRSAANILPLLRAEGFVAGLITPYPSAREAVDVYANNTTRVSAANSVGRAAILGTTLAFAVAYVIHLSNVFGQHAFRVVFFVLTALLIALIRTTFAWIVRRRAAQLDDVSAFSIVMSQVTRATDKYPDRVAQAMVFLPRNLVRIVEGKRK